MWKLPTLFKYEKTQIRSCDKVMFLHLSVILSTGGCLPQCMLGYKPRAYTPPGQTPLTLLGRHPLPSWADTPSLGRHHPRADNPWADTPLGSHPPGQTWCYMVNKQAVHFLLECILVNVTNSYVEKYFITLDVTNRVHVPFTWTRIWLAYFISQKMTINW